MDEEWEIVRMIGVRRSTRIECATAILAAKILETNSKPRVSSPGGKRSANQSKNENVNKLMKRMCS